MLVGLLLTSPACARSHDTSQQHPDAPSPGRPPVTRGITAEEDAGIAPGPPGEVRILHGGRIHRIEWQGTRDDTVRGYQIYRRCSGSPWQELAFVELHANDPRNRDTYVFEDPFGAVCDYAVAAVAADGRRGPLSVDIH
jgi:hypothetical protein